ncbi:hypothetical protein [Vreelandella populi]|uniref:hypothetical protein n=1 Tax=Vreelandella populi TaxID=2498858 RepID=UPI00163B7DA5|nr:hypothetical protein [Halomonas populi]
MEPANPYFQQWWQAWQKQQAGVATLSDLIATRVHWEMSMALQKRLGGLND